MFKSNKSTNNLTNVTMLGKHDSLERQSQPQPFLSMLTSHANKRLSFIDKGKSWARQLLRNSNKGLNASQNSFESCDSGIDQATSSFTRGSFNQSSKNNKFKVPQSSSCTFITSPYSSKSVSVASNSSSQPTAESTCTLTTSKSTSFTSSESSCSTYDVYSSPSNSSQSSSGYLISPVDESGYLVPISLTTRQTSFSERHQTKPTLMQNPKQRRNRLSNLIPSCSPLTRSFSTRSACTPNKSANSFASCNLNRATICEQIGATPNESNLCIKCNCKLNTTDASGQRSASSNPKSESNENAQDLSSNSKYNREYSLFESYTCHACIASDLSNNTNNKCKPPAVPAPLPPTIDSHQQRPPQPPLSHPPRAKSTTQVPTNPPPPLPLHPPPALNPTKGSNNLQPHFQNSILLLANSIDKRSSAQSANELQQLIQTLSKSEHQQKHQISKDNNNFKITPLLLCTPHLFNEPEGTTTTGSGTDTIKSPINQKLNIRKQVSRRKTPSCGPALQTRPSEPIVYIDSADLEQTNTTNSSSSSYSLSSSSNSSSNRSSISNQTSLDINMNQLIAKLRQNHQANSTPIQTINNRPPKTVHGHSTNPNYNKLSYNNSYQQHDYHVIDDLISENADYLKYVPQQQQARHRIPTSNSMSSFDFFEPVKSNNNSMRQVIKLDTSNGTSYEKSWENSTVILLDKLNEKLASSLIAIANEQRKQLEQSSSHTLSFNVNEEDDSQPVNNDTRQRCTMREKKPVQQQQQQHITLTNSKRISFPFQRVSIPKSSSQNITASSSSNSPASSQNHSYSISSELRSPSRAMPSSSTSTTISSTSSSTSSIRNESNSHSDDLEHLLSLSTNSHEEDPVNLIKSCTNTSASYHYTLTSEPECTESISESWYQPTLPREDVQGYLTEQEVGSFVIRLSNTCKNCYALSIRVPYFANQNGVAHYLITKNSRGFKLKGVEKEFKSLKSLVTHYSVMQEILPVTLNLSGSPNNQSNSTDNKVTSSMTSFNEQATNMACIY